jgi:hypothetical protein
VRVRVENLVFGLCLTTLGVLWILGNVGRIDFLGVVHVWWPLSLIVWGLLEIGFPLLWGRR